MLRLFELFIKKVKHRLRGIAKKAGNIVGPEDLEADAWIAARDIEEQRGREINFADGEDQEAILHAVYVKNVSRRDRVMRRAVSINAPDSVDTDSTLEDRLASPDSDNPLVAMLLQETALSKPELLATSYSQATAYVRAIGNLRNDYERLCVRVAISRSTLNQRLNSAAHVVLRQPSLFDRIERISSGFLPKPGKKCLAKKTEADPATQKMFSF